MYQGRSEEPVFPSVVLAPVKSGCKAATAPEAESSLHEHILLQEYSMFVNLKVNIFYSMIMALGPVQFNLIAIR